MNHRRVSIITPAEITPLMNDEDKLMGNGTSSITTTETIVPPSSRAEIRVNVGGRTTRFSIHSLQRCQYARLAQFAGQSHQDRLTDCDGYSEDAQEYYFERSPLIFDYIIDFYKTGKLHRPIDVCAIRFRNELEFWQLPMHLLNSCCRFEVIDAAKVNLNLPRASFNEQMNWEAFCPPKLFEKVCFGKFRFKIWTFFENPRSSIAAKSFSIISAIFVLISLSVLILGSMPELQDESQEPLWILYVTEVLCMIWFTFEYGSRFGVNPNKCEFVKMPLNVIDFMTIVPFYIEECLPLIGFDTVELRNIRGPMVVMRVMRLARVARIFKLARYSSGLQQFGATMRRSLTELSMLGMFLLTGIMLFSTAIYFFERDEPNSKFYSIPAACWWCVITMTTVGYGDLVPVTAGGKVVAAAASVCGIIVLAFPISMIIDKFNACTGGGFFSGGGSEMPTAVNGPIPVINTVTGQSNANCLSVAYGQQRARRASRFF